MDRLKLRWMKSAMSESSPLRDSPDPAPRSTSARVAASSSRSAIAPPTVKTPHALRVGGSPSFKVQKADHRTGKNHQVPGMRIRVEESVDKDLLHHQVRDRVWPPTGGGLQAVRWRRSPQVCPLRPVPSPAVARYRDLETRACHSPDSPRIARRSGGGVRPPLDSPVPEGGRAEAAPPPPPDARRAPLGLVPNSAANRCRMSRSVWTLDLILSASGPSRPPVPRSAAKRRWTCPMDRTPNRAARAPVQRRRRATGAVVRLRSPPQPSNGSGVTLS